jgi:enamine deaminase RidA (YjgF/YER057c/UK114 family)
MVIFRHIGAILASLGGTLEGQVRMNGWLRIPFQEFGPLAKVRRKMFTGPGMQVPATSFPMSGVRTKDALFEWQTIALLPPVAADDPRKAITMPQHPLAPYQVPALFAGPYLFTAGEVAIDTTVPRVVSSFADFDDAGRFIPYGRIHAEHPVMAQSLFVYEKLRSYLHACGLGMDRTVQQTVYMVNPSDYPQVERIATLFFGRTLPPTTIVPIRGVSPFREALLEIEITAVR